MSVSCNQPSSARVGHSVPCSPRLKRGLSAPLCFGSVSDVRLASRSCIALTQAPAECSTPTKLAVRAAPRRTYSSPATSLGRLARVRAIRSSARSSKPPPSPSSAAASRHGQGLGRKRGRRLRSEVSLTFLPQPSRYAPVEVDASTHATRYMPNQDERDAK